MDMKRNRPAGGNVVRLDGSVVWMDYRPWSYTSAWGRAEKVFTICADGDHPHFAVPCDSIYVSMDPNDNVEIDGGYRPYRAYMGQSVGDARTLFGVQ